MKQGVIDLVRLLPISSVVLGTPKGFYHSTLDYIAINNLKENYLEIYPSHWIYRSNPKTLSETIDWRFSVGYLGNKFKTPPAFVVLLKNGRVCGSGGAVISPDDKLMADVSIEIGVPPEKAKNHSIFTKIKLPKLSNLQGTVAVLSATSGNGYFHWMFDILPRIHLLQQSCFIDYIDSFLLPKLNFRFQEETLNILGIPNKKIIATDNNFHVKADKLVVPSLPGITGSMTKWSCDFLRKEFLRDRSIPRGDRGECFYISRAKAKHRRILNEDEVIGLLRESGFQVWTMENISVLEQASLFASAKVIISAHGAGLTNLVFCSPNTKVIELFSPKYVNPCYRALSNLMELEYWYLMGQGDLIQENSDEHLTQYVSEDITIDINSLEKLIQIAGISHNLS